MDDYSKCPLHWLVCTDNFYRQFQARLKDPNEIDTMGLTLLHVAAQSPVENLRIMKLLLDRGADVNSTTLEGHTPLHFAVTSRKVVTVVALIKEGADVNSKDILGRTPLHSVCKAQSYLPNSAVHPGLDIIIVERLLCHPDINVNTVDQTGNTPLMWAVKKRNSSAVCALLKKGANPNISNKYQRTPLHEVFSSGNQDCDIATSLLKNGADIYSKDNLQQTPMDIFVRNEWSFSFSAFCVWLIALRYHISDCLKRKLEQIPGISYYLGNCCEEARLMRKIIIYDNVTLHDFALDCFQMYVRDPVREIYIPVVEVLLSGLFKMYFELILGRLSQSDLLSVLEIIGSRWFSKILIFRESSNITIYNAIRYFYNQNVMLKRRLLRFKYFMT